MSLFSTVFSYCLVGLLWGITNPYIKYGQAVFKKKKMNQLQQEFDEQQRLLLESQDSADPAMLPKSLPSDKMSTLDSVRLMFSEPFVYLPFIVNQSGSFVFLYVLIREPISIAAPVCNSLAFIFTAVTGYYIFREEVQSPFLLVSGILLVLMGIYVCISNDT